MTFDADEAAIDNSKSGLQCWICCDGDGHVKLLPTGCGCRGSAGYAHLCCLVKAATHNVDRWTMCPTCLQDFTGEAEVGLAHARWDLVRDRSADDAERLFVAMNLAVAMKESGGDNEGALKLLEEIVEVRRRTLGDEDPMTLDSITNLALQHSEMGNFEAALPLSEEAAAGMRQALGGEHEHTLIALGGLAALYTLMGKNMQARPLHKQVLEARRRILGDTHLDTMNSCHGLGLCLVAMGERDDGLVLLEEAVSSSQRVLGETHPSTQHFEEGLHDAQRECSEAARP